MSQDLIQEIQSTYVDHPGYRHTFWEWFASSDLTIESLREFALLYYEHVRRFRLYIAGAITVAPTECLQTVLSEILADEYGVPIVGHPPADSHPEMFRAFMRSIGLTESDWEGNDPLPGIRYFKAMHFALFHGGLTPEAIGAVAFGMESSTPHRHGMVLKGLDRFTARTDIPVDSTFFASHVSIDEVHSAELFSAAMPLFQSDPDGAARGARYSFDARAVFLDDLQARLASGRADGR
jgi:pyrroloquinoline-quinone synthase